MRWASVARLSVLVIVLSIGAARQAPGFEAFDGRLQAHGFGETVARTINSDFTDDFDLTQWQFVLNLEIEFDIAPYGWGPFSALSAYARVETRYDCVWSRACAIFPSADAYGDRAVKLPEYLSDAEESPFSATTFGKPDATAEMPNGRLIRFRDLQGIDTLYNTEPASEATFGDFGEYQIATRRTRGSINGKGFSLLAPWEPGDQVEPIGALSNVPNALSAIESGPSGMPFLTNFKPFVPVPTITADTAAPNTVARGLYFPSAGLVEQIRDEEFDPLDQNFRESELAWNRGGSQQDEKELKELYVDVEMLDGRLWLRLGKQTIVWGKTEIFRSQDQFNPQDLGLSTLPSLEESRIGLWAARAVWSFYDVGPVQDVRLELAMLLDDFEPVDLGQCGEPYAPFPSCGVRSGAFVHGILGFGLAGAQRPPAWWNDTRGIEAGARLEFRWRRFSFAITDFYGFDDFPSAVPIFTYSRNVDPRTGRPRRTESTGGCDPEGLFDGDISGCLASPSSLPFAANFTRINAERANFSAAREDIIANASTNQTFFHTFCSATVGFGTGISPALAPECSFAVLGSSAVVAGLPLNSLISAIGAGDVNITNLVLFGTFPSLVSRVPVVPLNQGVRDGEGAAPIGVVSFANTLSPEQQALLGCGPYYGTSCDTDGIDLLNAEASAIFQSWLGFEGSPIRDLTVMTPGQPGTTAFAGAIPCTRFEGGRLFVLPGCDGPGVDPGGQAASSVPAGLTFAGVNGNPVFQGALLGFFNTTLGNLRAAGLSACSDAVVGQRLFHPFTCEPFQSEMAALSFNLQFLSVIFSTQDGEDADGDGSLLDFDEFDATQPYAAGRCSFASPQFCSIIRSFLGVSGVRRNTIDAGGNGRFGRRDFLWHGGQEVVLRWAKRNVLGASMDFAEDYSKTNWSLEFTWVESNPTTDRDANDGLTEVDTYNLTISVDRPTFVNFLNANRTFLFNSQFFIRYVPQHKESFSSNGPWNVLGTFTIISGYFQDRLLTNVTFVYDFQSNSGAGLPSVTYRFTESFSAQFGMALFFGRFQFRDPFLNPASLGNRVGTHAYKDVVENGLAVVRDREEMFLRIRWTF